MKSNFKDTDKHKGLACQLFSTKPSYLLLAVLVLSGFTHIWNAAGFPDIFFDEGVYMRRAMHVMAGLGPQEAFFYDHPFFGQVFLASVLTVIGFPNSFHPAATADSISTLYLAPRVIMGVLAVFDTLLIYKIAENRYGTKIALISSLFFAVMPMTWLVRRILLDSILLPFFLTSVLFALKSKNSRHKGLLVLLSGILMGIAIFTKIPIFTMIPLIAGLVYFGNGKNVKLVVLWLVPVVLIPMLWPLQSVEVGQFNLWMSDVIGQTERHSAGLDYTMSIFLNMDPVLFILGIAGMSFCIFRKDYFILTWFVPFMLFLFAIQYNQYFYYIPLLPVFCISAAVLVTKIIGYVKQQNRRKFFSYVTVLGISIFGLISTTMLITTNMTSSEFQATAFVLQHVKDSNNDTTILASPTYSWIFNYVFHRPNVLIDYSIALFQPLETSKVVLVADPHFMLDINRGPQLQQIYNDTTKVATFEGNVVKYDDRFYPYENLWTTRDGSHIEIREK